MPWRIIRPCIVLGMKPRELVYALMVELGLNPSSLSRKMKSGNKQPLIHRYLQGKVERPDAATAMPMARVLGIPLEAIYEEKQASAYAKAHGIHAIPIPEAKKREKKDAAVDDFARSTGKKFSELDPLRQKIIRALIEGGDGAPSPSQEKVLRTIEAHFDKNIRHNPDGITGTTRPGSLEPAIESAAASRTARKPKGR